jgi:hypothetical protein
LRWRNAVEEELVHLFGEALAAGPLAVGGKDELVEESDAEDHADGVGR